MKLSDMKQSTVAELQEEVHALLKEQFNLRMQRGSGQPVRPDLFGKVRKNIARAKTIIADKTKEGAAQ